MKERKEPSRKTIESGGAVGLDINFVIDSNGA